MFHGKIVHVFIVLKVSSRIKIALFNGSINEKIIIRNKIHNTNLKKRNIENTCTQQN